MLKQEGYLARCNPDFIFGFNLGEVFSMKETVQYINTRSTTAILYRQYRMKGRKTQQKQKSGIKSVIEKKKSNPQKNQWRSKGYNKK